MAQLNINYEETKTTGKSVVNEATDFKKLLSEIRSLNSTLKTYWQGNDASKYTERVDDQAATMDLLGQKIEDIGNFLQQVGKAYEDAMSANRDALNK